MSPLRPISPKKLAALDGKMPRSTLKASGEERFPGLKDDDYRTWIRALPCIVASASCRYVRDREGMHSDPAHVRTKATGAGDAGNLVPLCRGHHDEQHNYGPRSFAVVHREALDGKTLRECAAELWVRYEGERGVTL